MNRELVNIEASIRQRLKNISESTGRPFTEVLQWYAIERFLARLAATEHVRDFVLKGGALLRVWDANPGRPTMDIDLAVAQVREQDEILLVIGDCLSAAVEEDGLRFDAETLEVREIRIAHRYPGIRVRFRGCLGVARFVMQVDVGFSDSIVPPADEIRYPSLLGFDSGILRGYTPETVIAEKLEAMVQLGMRTSRMKDYFDVWWLISQKAFRSEVVTCAIAATFGRRGTDVPEGTPEALSDSIAESPEKSAQWAAFRRRSQIEHPTDFKEVVRQVRVFAHPILQLFARGSEGTGEWPPGGPWKFDPFGSQ